METTAPAINDLLIDVFPMMQTGMGYWWAVCDLRGHILKLGRTDTEMSAQAAAYAWARRVSEQENNS